MLAYIVPYKQYGIILIVTGFFHVHLSSSLQIFKSQCLGVGDMGLVLEESFRNGWRMVNLTALFQMWALLRRTAKTLKSGGLVIVVIIGLCPNTTHAPMTRVHSATVVDSAK